MSTATHATSSSSSPNKPFSADTLSSPLTKPTSTSSNEPAPLLNSSNEAQSDSKTAPPQDMEYHRQVLQNRLAANDADKQTYISPSDTIMSPCTAKLSAYKGKRFAKAKPQSLFVTRKTTAPTPAPAPSESMMVGGAAVQDMGTGVGGGK